MFFIGENGAGNPEKHEENSETAADEPPNKEGETESEQKGL